MSNYNIGDEVTYKNNSEIFRPVEAKIVAFDETGEGVFIEHPDGWYPTEGEQKRKGFDPYKPYVFAFYEEIALLPL